MHIGPIILSWADATHVSLMPRGKPTPPVLAPPGSVMLPLHTEAAGQQPQVHVVSAQSLGAGGPENAHPCVYLPRCWATNRDRWGNYVSLSHARTACESMQLFDTLQMGQVAGGCRTTLLCAH